MKKTVFIIALVTALALVAGCKSKPPPPDPSLSDVEKTFYYLYHRFSNDLILEGAKEHTVVSGDTLARLAQAEYNDAHYYPLIMLASKDVILDPDKINVGMKLTIPDLQKNLDHPRASQNLKKFLLEVADIEEERGRKSTADGMRARSAAIN